MCFDLMKVGLGGYILSYVFWSIGSTPQLLICAVFEYRLFSCEKRNAWFNSQKTLVLAQVLDFITCITLVRSLIVFLISEMEVIITSPQNCDDK